MDRTATSLKTIRVAVIGGGAFGEAHLRTYASMPLVEIAGVFTLDSQRGNELVQRFGGKNYASLMAMAKDPVIDLVSIVTPEDQHLPAFEALAQQGKAIYIEKPLATSLAEARRILELSESLCAMSGHCLRFEQRVVQVMDRLGEGARHHLSFRNRRTRIEKTIYGRVHPAYAMLCHEIELSNAFARSRFSRVAAMETHFSEGQVDGMNILIEYENGVTSSIDGGWYLPAQGSSIENDTFSILSEQGIDEITIPNLGYYRLTERGIEVPNQFYGHTIHGVEYGPLRAALDYMVACIRLSRLPAVAPIRDAYHAVELIEAALESVATKGWVSRSKSS